MIQNDMIILLTTTDQIQIKDFKFSFHVKVVDDKTFILDQLISIRNHIQVKYVDGKDFSKFYHDEEEEYFVNVTVKSFSLIEMIKNVLLKNKSVQTYGLDIDVINHFLIKTGLKYNKEFEINDDPSYKTIKVNNNKNRQKIEKNCFYFSIFIYNETDRVPIPRWTRSLAEHYGWDFEEVHFNSFTDPIRIITFITNNVATVYHVAEDETIDTEIEENIKLFTKMEDLTINIKRFDLELDMILHFLEELSKCNNNFVCGWDVDYMLHYIRERIIENSEGINNNNFKKHPLYLFYKQISGHDIDTRFLFENLNLLCKNDNKIGLHLYSRKIIRNIIDIKTLWFNKLLNRDCKIGSDMNDIYKHLFNYNVVVPSTSYIKKNDINKIFLYQLKQTFIPMLIQNHKMFLQDIMEMCSITPITISQAIEKGQMCRIQHLILDSIKNGEEKIFLKTIRNREKEKFKGGFVLEPGSFGLKTGYIGETDFRSYYPSIICAFNLCFSTILNKEQMKKYKKQDYLILIIDGKQIYVLKSSVKKGRISIIVNGLMEQRKVIKQKIKESKDQIEIENLEFKEKTLKTLANSFFGTLGSVLVDNIIIAKIITTLAKRISMFSMNVINNMNITEDNNVTLPGEMIYDLNTHINLETKTTFGKHFKVFYIDTDSFYIETIEKYNLHQTSNMLNQICNLMNEIFENFTSGGKLYLDLKCICPISFWVQKRHYYYQSILPITENIKDEDIFTGMKQKVESKGSVPVKSNKINYLKKIINFMMNELLNVKNLNENELKNTKDQLKTYISNQASKFNKNGVKISDFITSNKYKKEYREYKGKTLPNHVKMIEWHRFVNKETYKIPTLNQNVKLIYYKNEKKRSIDSVMSPSFLVDNNKNKLNLEYYIEMIRNDLEMILKLMFKDEKGESIIDIVSNNYKESLKRKRNITMMEKNKKIKDCQQCIFNNDELLFKYDDCENKSCNNFLNIKYIF